MRMGVVSDTHGYFDSRLPQLLNGVDEIFHAGDVGSGAVLDQLRALAAIQAVRGNIDPPELELPPTLTAARGNATIYMVHALGKPQSMLCEWAQSPSRDDCRQFLRAFPSATDLVIFGHSHEPCAVVLNGKLFFNPGSAGKRRFSLPRCCGMLEISSAGVKATFLSLESYNRGLPESVYLPTKGA